MKPANYAPIYACVYAQLAEVARSHGYALAAHGSLAADFDLVCIPWVPGVSDPQSVVDEITSRFAIKQVGAPEQKKHGRIAYTISFEFGECRLDLSFMPTEAAQDQGEVQRLREQWVPVSERMPEKECAVLAYYLNSHGKGRRIRAEYIAAKTVEAEMFADPDTECVEYDEASDTYYVLEGWYESIDNWPDYSRAAVIEGQITHWMPLPDAPAIAASTGQEVES